MVCQDFRADYLLFILKTLCGTACFAGVCYCCDEQSVLAGFVN